MPLQLLSKGIFCDEPKSYIESKGVAVANFAGGLSPCSKEKVQKEGLKSPSINTGGLRLLFDEQSRGVGGKCL
jgi:hypothetical protein